MPERRAEFIFGTAAEVMQMMSDLPSKVTMFGHGKIEEGTSAAPEGDAMAAAIHAAKKQGGAAPAAGSK